MMHFEYKALGQDGSVLSGTVDCVNRGEAMTRLKSEGLTLLDLVAKEAPAASNRSFIPALEFRKIRPQQLAFLFRQLGELIEAGLPIVGAVSSLQRFCGNDKTRHMLSDVSHRIRSGQGFTDALAAQTGVFSRIQLALISVGERSGTLDEVLKRIADLMETQLELRGKIRAALSYPFFILAFSSLLCWGLVTFLLPSFEPMWKGANLDLNKYPVTLFLMKISVFFRTPLDEIGLILLIIGLAVAFLRMTSSPEGQDALGAFLLKVPLLGSYLQISATAEASATMARLLECGMPIIEVLDLTAETASNSVVANSLKMAGQALREGGDLSSAFESMDVFPELFVQMVAVGESTGEMPAMLHRVASYYKRQLDDSLRSLTALIEPVMMVIIGGVVFVFVLGVFMPIMGIVGTLSQ